METETNEVLTRLRTRAIDNSLEAFSELRDKTQVFTFRVPVFYDGVKYPLQHFVSRTTLN